MIYKGAAGMFLFAALLLSQPAFAQDGKTVGGRFYGDCGSGADSYALTVVLNNHLRVWVDAGNVMPGPDGVYRTKGQTMEGEKENMRVSLCDERMENCRPVEGVLTAYKYDGVSFEGALEYFDGTEVQGDSESIEGHMARFKAMHDRSKPIVVCD